ncbi:MAG: tetratricopeptide repeat protein [Acidobacteriaceae bacterium]
MHSFRQAVVMSLISLFLLPAAQAATQQADNSVAIRNEKILQMHYQAAMKYQQTHQLDLAAQQYRIFLADALGELAIAEAHGYEYGKAAPDFDAALSLAPNSPALLVEYSEAALHAGRVQHAASLAQQVIENYPKNKNAQARAYSLLGRAQLKMGKSAEARKSLEKALALDPDFQNGYNLAVACLNLEDQKCAEKVFDEMKAGYGNKAILHMFFGQAYMDSDFQSKAVGEFQQAVALDGKLPGAHYSLAAAYLISGQHVAEAEAQLKQEIALYPHEAMAHAALGHLEAGQHDYAAAERELLLAATIDPRDPDTFFYLGQLYAAMSKNDRAIAALRQSIALTKDVTRNHDQVQKAHYLLGRLLLKSGDRAAAQKELEISQQLMNKNLSRAREQLANYYDQGAGGAGNADSPVVKTPAMETKASLEAAQAAAGFAKRVGPFIANSYNNLGAIAGMQGDVKSAYDYFRHAKQWDPQMPGLNENLGRAAFSSFHFAEAVEPLTAYVSGHPQDVAMRSALGVSLYMTKDYGKARDALAPVIASGKVTDEISFIYADCLVKAGHLQEGIARLKGLAAKLPQEESLRRALGEAYAASGDMTRALEELQAAEKMDGKDAQVHADLASVYKKMGRQAEAAREAQEHEAPAGTKNGGK